MKGPLEQFSDFPHTGSDMEALARPLLATLEAAIGLESTYLTSVDEAAGVQRILFSHNTRQLQIPEGLEVPWGDTLCRRALEEGESWVPDVPARWPESAAARDLGIVSYVSSPIFTRQGQLVGTLCGASREHKPPNGEALTLLNLFANLVGERIGQEQLIGQLQLANHELAAQAMVDALTGLPNRRALLAELSRELFRAARSGRHVAVAFIDLDGFKAINDQHGHVAGDRFLAAIGQRLSYGLRGSDFAARYGGDEFVVVSPNADEDGARQLGQRLDALIAGEYELGTARIDYGGTSIGVLLAAGGREAEDVLKEADGLMYAAKRARRGVAAGAD